MRLVESDAWERVAGAEHGVLGTIHPDRGIDLVPVVYAVDDEHTIFLPIDTVKEKTSIRLQRLKNLANDPRCTLLIEHYEKDWARLWWVRINGQGKQAGPAEMERARGSLAERYPQYADPAAMVGGIMMTPQGLQGWEAG